MRRPLRRIHFLIWLALAPLTLAAALIALSLAPDTPFSELPPGVEEVD